MKINIVYESKFGNGKKMIEELAGILTEKKQEVKLFPVTETKIDDLPGADLYIFSTPTRQFMLPRAMKNFLKRFQLPAGEAKYALMTTFLDPRTIALRKMEALLESKAMKKAANNFKVKALGLKGPLEDYKDRLEKFAEEILKD